MATVIMPTLRKRTLKTICEFLGQKKTMDANLTPAGSEYTLGKDLMIFETNFSPKNQVIPDTPCFSGRVDGPGDSSEEG